MIGAEPTLQVRVRPDAAGKYMYDGMNQYEAETKLNNVFEQMLAAGNKGVFPLLTLKSVYVLATQDEVNSVISVVVGAWRQYGSIYLQLATGDIIDNSIEWVPVKNSWDV